MSAALVGGLATPAMAGERADPASPILGGFSIGDGLEALIDERDGALHLDLPVAGIGLSWDSRRIGQDRSGLGPGWNWAIGSIDVDGGVRVFTSSGAVYAADASAPSGLAGYGGGEVRFEQREGTLEARPGIVEARAYAYVLHELGGASTYFSAAGDPIARVEASNDRLDWLWADEPAHRLTAIVGVEGVRTELGWEDGSSAVVVRPAANVDAAATTEWRIALGAFGPTEVVDATGRTRSVGYDPQGNLVQVMSETGAATEVSWAQADDGVTRVSRVQTVEPGGRELSRREWSSEPGTSPTGWPSHSDPGMAGFVTHLTDGASEVVSSYADAGLLAHRSFRVSEPAGLRAVQEVEFSYPDTSAGSPASWSHPTSTVLTSLDAQGGVREARESSVYDELGRVIEHTAADGAVTRTEYDSTPGDDAGLPVGLPVREVLETSDGHVRERVNTLDERRIAVVGTQVTERAPGGQAAITERVEYDVDDDGFVRTKREYPTGPTAAPPVVTTWDERVDLHGGTTTSTQTVAAGTRAEATTAQVTSLVHGNVVAEVDALGNRSTSEYDEIGRLEARHDAAGRGTTFAYAADDGRSIVTETGPDGVARSEVRDALGRVVEVTDNVDHGEPVAGHVRRVESREYRNGLVRVTDAWGAVSTARHDMFGRAVAVTGTSGATELTEYDDARGVVRFGVSATGDLADANVVREETRDAAGRTVRTDEQRADDGSQMTATSEFDGFGRIEATTTGGLQTDVEYDRLGRPVFTTLSSTSDGVAEAEASADPLLTAAVGYDAFGRSTRSVEGAVSGYDAANRRVSTTTADGVTTTTAYWPDGSRRSQVVGDDTTSFYWDGDTLINERESGAEGASTGVASYLIGASRLARSVSTGSLSAGAAEYYGTDRHGNVTELIDQQGAVVATYDYSDYGVTSSAGRDETRSALARNPYRYAGEYTDRDGTQFLMTRAYHSGTARFTSMDKAPLENRFAFADLNPIMHVDPTGQTSALDVVNWIVAGTALVAGIASGVGTIWAMSVSHTLGALSIAAAAADAVALGFATAGLVDSYAFNFMDDETANLVALGDIALGVGLGLGLGVLDGVLTHVDRGLRKIFPSAKPARVSKFDTNVDPDQVPVSSPVPVRKGPPTTIDDPRPWSEQWSDLKTTLRTLTNRGEHAPTRTQQGRLVGELEQNGFFMRLSGLDGTRGVPATAGVDDALLKSVSTSELLANPSIRDYGLIDVNRRLVIDARDIVLSVSSRSYET